MSAASAERIESRYFFMESSDWALIDSSLTRYTPHSLLAECDYYLEKICEYLKLDYGRIRKLAVRINQDQMYYGMQAAATDLLPAYSEGFAELMDELFTRQPARDRAGYVPVDGFCKYMLTGWPRFSSTFAMIINGELGVPTMFWY